MFQSKKVGLLAKIILLILLAYMIFTLVSVRQKIADANAAVETLTQQVSDQTQTNTELSNAIENRDDILYSTTGKKKRTFSKFFSTFLKFLPTEP